VGSTPASPTIVNIKVAVMKKWIGPLLSLFLVITFGISLVSGSLPLLGKGKPKETRTGEYQIIPVQDEKREETDPHLILILKEIQKKLDEWLKSINERIESEDITRLEVRFLEVLRNILEWIKEKVDAKIESNEKEKPIRKKGKGLFREIHQRNFLISKIG
jgi:hypothetical protein